MKRALRIVLFGLLALVVTAAVVLVLVVKIGLAPARGEWAVKVPIGPFSTEVGVPTVLRVATSPWLAPRLDGFGLTTRHGPVRLQWDEAQHQLRARCAPCTASVPALGSQPLRFDHLLFDVRRDGERLRGTLEVAAPAAIDHPLRGEWTGNLSQTELQLDINIDDAPIARWYAVLLPDLPELKRARIEGTMGLRTQIAQPSGRFAVQPRVDQFRVDGLGTAAMVGAHTSCGPASNLGADSWLARAVIAAEDQRFFTHPGYDIVELVAALDRNQRKEPAADKPGTPAANAEADATPGVVLRGGIVRGGSTLTQQVAKMLVTGGERSLERKLREMLYAVEMEQTLGKTRILQLYLDNAPWGAQVCGADAAARHYFKRTANRLEPAQAVWLASMLHAPVAAAERWKRDGQLDEHRVRWVADGVRGISRRQRDALLRSIETARYPYPAPAS